MKSIETIQKLERIVLSYILNDTKLYLANTDIFARNLFRNCQICIKIFKALEKLIADGKHPDIIEISNITGIDMIEIAEIYTCINYDFDFKNSIRSLIDNIISQNLLSLSFDIQSKVRDNTDVFSIISTVKEFVSSNESSSLKRVSPIDEHIHDLVELINLRQQQKSTGVLTGLQKFDAHTGGLQPSDLIIVAAETSAGKTSLGLTISYNGAVKYNGRIAIFSFEMSSEQLAARLAAMETGISSKKILFQKLARSESDKISNMQQLPASAIYIDDCRSSSIEYLLTGIRIAHMQHEIQVVVVDYLQLVHDSSKRNDESEISSNTRRLKNIAKELNITVILLSQLSRDKINPKPTLARLRGSGQIEEAADIVVLIWRPEIWNIKTYDDSPLPNTYNNAEIIIAKGRNIGLTRMWLNFNPELTYFSNCEYESNDQS